MKGCTMKSRILGAVVFFAFVVAPATAKHANSGPHRYVQSIYCATREMGNPYSKYCDYNGWTAWRRRGGWDSRLDDICSYNPAYVPPGCF
jgi:hypothetical protein